MLVGCGSEAPPQASAPAATEVNQDSAESLPEPAADPQLIPLYPPDEVLNALQRGRQDPFAPPPQALVVAKEEASESEGEGGPALSEGERVPELMGVSSIGGVAQAFVSYGSHSGPVAPGDVGGANGLPWLPEGISVAGVDVQRGLLLLERNGQPLSPIQL